MPASCRGASNFEVAAQPRDVALRRCAELFFVVAAEVRWVLVADFEAGARGVEVSSEHEAAGFLQADLFLVLQRTHCRDAFEVMMEA